MRNEGKEIKRGTHLSMSNRILTNTIRAALAPCKMHSVAHRSTFHHASAVDRLRDEKQGRGGGRGRRAEKLCVTETKGGRTVESRVDR